MGIKLTAKVHYSEIQADNCGIYMWLNPDEMSAIEITRILRTAPFKTFDSTELHTTVMHVKNSLPGTLQAPKDVSYGAQITSIDAWQDHKDRTILVIRMDSPELMALHANLAKQGLVHSHHEYNPHMTIAKAIDLNAESRLWLDEVNARLQWKPRPITFSPQLRATSLS